MTNVARKLQVDAEMGHGQCNAYVTAAVSES